MKKKDREELDDLFRSKLYDFEEEILPEDWEAIEARLPRPSIASYGKRKSYYWAAAAVAALLMVSSGIYYWGETPEAEQLAQEIEQQPVVVPVKPDPVSTEKEQEVQPALAQLLAVEEEADPVLSAKETSIPRVAVTDETIYLSTDEQSVAIDIPPLSYDQKVIKTSVPMFKSTKESFHGKWSFGMGAGSISAGNTTSLGSFDLRGSSVLSSESLEAMNSASFYKNLPKTEVRHKMPLSFGLSVSRYLSDRWSLQTGLIYSYLSSSWETESVFKGECDQRLHFLGIPVAISYKIAEWDRFQFYASAGVKAELNVAGKVRTDLHVHDEKLMSVAEKQRMKEPYFSVNGRVGVSYPIIRFVSAYAEAGVDYYFDNGSDIETYHSDKPLNVGLQIGLRLGF